jgi:leucyl-tRNA synthetase
VSTDAYVFVNCPTVGGTLDLTQQRGYALADAYARYRRARGEDVLFALGFDTFGTTPKPADGQAVDEWIEGRCASLKEALESLSISFDWDRTVLTSDPDVYRWSQLLFVELLKAGLVYQHGGKGWFLRMDSFNEENDSKVDQLEGWSEAARAGQRALLQRVDGSEFEAQALDGTTLKLFTAHPDSIADAEFVGLAPSRPELDGWLVDDAEVSQGLAEMRNRDWSDVPPAELPVVEIPMSVQVPSVAAPLPVLVSPSIELRFGPAAVLGVPKVDATDKVLGKQLPKAGGLAWKIESKPPRTSPAVRYLAADMPLSRGRAWGAPVPVVHCDECGVVGVPAEQLPLRPPANLDVTARGNALAEDANYLKCECPKCGAPARRDAGTLHPRLGAAWIEVALAVPSSDRAERMFGHSDLARWLPTAQTIEGPNADDALLDMRTVAKALRETGALELESGEPHGPTLLHEAMEIEGQVSGEGLSEAYGSDAVRFALLYAAAPGKAFSGGTEVVRHSAAFLDELRAFVESRLGGAGGDARIDTNDGLRRRLASWCDTAVSRVAENYEDLAMHRATRNVVELLARIQDFERRVSEHRGEISGADLEAVGVATQVLIRLLAPLTPAFTDNLWLACGNNGTVGQSTWPDLQREPAAA